MTQELKQYLKDNKIKFTEVDDSFYMDGNKDFILVTPNEEGKLFTEDFTLITDVPPKEDQYYIFKFGGKWYYCNDPSKPELNLLKYVGKSKLEFEAVPFLGIHGKYEILNGSRDYNDWCKKAHFLNIDTLGICEKNTLAGTLPFQLSCKKNNIKPILGATYTIDRNDYKYDIKCYVKNKAGWDNLLKINKEVKIVNNGFIKEQDFLKLLDGLILVIDPKSIDFNNIFPLDVHLTPAYYQLDTCEYVNNDRDKWYLNNLKKFVDSNFEPVFITDAYYLDKEDVHIKKKLNLIANKLEYECTNQYFKPLDDYIVELCDLFPEEKLGKYYDKAIKNIKKITKQCDFEIETGTKHLPKYKMTDEEKKKYDNNEDLFWSIIQDGIKKKVQESNIDKYIERIGIEFEVIQQGKVLDYFLILWDIVKWSRKNGILTGIGRGSAGGSLIAYLMDITHLDPIRFDLLFERFLNEGRVGNSLPDIDTDFPGEKRSEVKNYMEKRYGKEAVCSVGTYGTFQMRVLLKDFARLENSSHKEMNYLTKILDLDKGNFTELFKNAASKHRLKVFVQNHVDLINSIDLAIEQPKNESIHACATVITPTEKSIYKWIPLKWGERDGEKMLVSEWEGGELESAGFLKEDILGIKQLDKFTSILKSIKEVEKKDIDIYNIPYDSDKVYDYFCNGWNGDVFHFRSAGLTGYCKQLQPQNIEDLITGIALYRPGAMESNFHNEYIIRSRKHIDQDEGQVKYFEGCEDITKKTKGLIVYQEQIMKICQQLGGFSLVEADDIRKAMGKKKTALINSYGEKFISRAIKNGYSKDNMSGLWNMMKEFAKYAFNRSHAAAYSITGYISQWFKVHYPVHFWQTAFSYASDNDIAGYISEIQKTGDILVTPPEINTSSNTFKADFNKNNIRWSLSSIKQCKDKAVEEILKIREEGQYFSFEEFLSRHNFKGSKVNKAVIENLVYSGVFDELENITNVRNRKNLIDFYREEYKVKVDKDKDKLHTDKDYLNEEWWWILQKKLLSGFALFPYEELLKKTMEDNDYEIVDASLFQELEAGQKVKIGGYIQEIIINNNKNGEWARILLESNYEFITVTVWSEEWKILQEIFQESEDKIALFSGIVNDFRNTKNLVLTNDSEVFLLD